LIVGQAHGASTPAPVATATDANALDADAAVSGKNIKAAACY